MFTDDAFAVPFGLGFPSDALKARTAARLRSAERDLLRHDPDSPAMRRAFDRWNADRKLAHPEGRLSSPGVKSLQPLDKYIDEEIDAAMKAFDRKINPMLEFTFGVATQAAEKAQETTTRPPPRLDVPGTPSGTVPQPVGAGLRQAVLPAADRGEK